MHFLIFLLAVSFGTPDDLLSRNAELKSMTSTMNKYDLRENVMLIAQRVMEARRNEEEPTEAIDVLLGRIGELQVRLNLPEDSAKTFGIIDDESVRNAMLCYTARYYAKQGNVTRAMASLDEWGIRRSSWSLSGILDELCLQQRFREATELVSYVEIDQRSTVLGTIARYAIDARALSVVEAILPSLDIDTRAEILIETAKALSREPALKPVALRYLKRAVELFNQSGEKLVRLRVHAAAIYDVLGDRDSADRIQTQQFDDAARANCLLERAAALALAGKTADVLRYCEVARGWDPSANPFNVVKACTQAGAMDIALELVSRYATDESLSSWLSEAVYAEALKSGNLQGALAAAQLMSSPTTRCLAMLDCLEPSLNSAPTRRLPSSVTRSALAEIEYHLRYIDDATERLLVQVRVERQWITLNGTAAGRPALKRLLQQLKRNLPEKGRTEPAVHRDRWTREDTLLTNLCDGLTEAGLIAERESLLATQNEASTRIAWKISWLVRHGRCEEALAVATVDQGQAASEQRISIIYDAAMAGYGEWALDRVREIEDSGMQSEALVEVLEIIADYSEEHARDGWRETIAIGCPAVIP